MANKFYAVRQGRQVGIFESWSSCEKQVKNYSGAVYKSFKNLEDAKAYLDYEKTEGNCNNSDSIAYPCAYVDGSYDSQTKRFSFGAVIMMNEDTECSFSKSFNNSADAEMRNVAGELQGSIFAIRYALEHGWPEIHIYFDYNGIEKWATGEWKRNLAATQSYYEFCQSALKKLKITFIKVKGHSGNKYNDKADALARSALNL